MHPFTVLKDESHLMGHPGLEHARTISDARSSVARVLSPHRLDVRGGGDVDVTFRRISAGALPVLLLRYGADVEIFPEPLSGHVLLQIMVSGRAELDNGRETIVSLPGDAMIVESLSGCALRWSADCEKIIIPIAHSALRAAIESVTGTSMAVPTGFDRHFRLDGPPHCGTLELVRYIVSQAMLPDAPDALGTSAQDLLARHLVIHHSSFDRRASSVVSGPVRRAEAYMRANLDEEIDLEGLATAARASARTLCDAFRRFRGRSPLATLRDMRLDAVRARLSGPNPPSVTEAAVHYRLYHVGRFAAAYKARFGELPSETLRRNDVLA